MRWHELLVAIAVILVRRRTRLPHDPLDERIDAVVGGLPDELQKISTLIVLALGQGILVCVRVDERVA